MQKERQNIIEGIRYLLSALCSFPIKPRAQAKDRRKSHKICSTNAALKLHHTAAARIICRPPYGKVTWFTHLRVERTLRWIMGVCRRTLPSHVRSKICKKYGGLNLRGNLRSGSKQILFLYLRLTSSSSYVHDVIIVQLFSPSPHLDSRLSRTPSYKPKQACPSPSPQATSEQRNEEHESRRRKANAAS